MKLSELENLNYTVIDETLYNVVLNELDLRFTDLDAEGAVFHNCGISKNFLEGCTLIQGVSFNYCEFVGVDFELISFKDCTIKSCVFTDCSLNKLVLLDTLFLDNKVTQRLPSSDFSYGLLDHTPATILYPEYP